MVNVTKSTHSCLLMEVLEPASRTCVFDPDVYWTLDVDRLRQKFPAVCISAPPDAAGELADAGITGVPTKGPRV